MDQSCSCAAGEQGIQPGCIDVGAQQRLEIPNMWTSGSCSGIKELAAVVAAARRSLAEWAAGSAAGHDMG